MVQVFLLVFAVLRFDVVRCIRCRATTWQCTRIARAFEKTIEATCIDNVHFWYANAGFSIATDVIIPVLPMYLIYKLYIPTEQKLALVVIFTLGGLVLIIPIVQITTIDNLPMTDITYDSLSNMWPIVESNVAVICACLPMIRPFLDQFFPKFMSRSTGKVSSDHRRRPEPGSHGSRCNHAGQGSQLRNHCLELACRGPVTKHRTTIQRAELLEDSDEDIMLAEAGMFFDMAYLGGIRKTTQYEVAYSSQ